MEQDTSNPALEIINRLRSLENRYTLLGEQMLVINQNMILQYKKFNSEFKNLNKEIEQLQGESTTTKETIKRLAKEMQAFAKQTDIKVLEKYINMWNPIHFVTEKDIDKIIEEKIKGDKPAKGKSNK